jgi:hypothetical protein
VHSVISAEAIDINNIHKINVCALMLGIQRRRSLEQIRMRKTMERGADIHTDKQRKNETDKKIIIIRDNCSENVERGKEGRKARIRTDF